MKPISSEAEITKRFNITYVVTATSSDKDMIYVEIHYLKDTKVTRFNVSSYEYNNLYPIINEKLLMEERKSKLKKIMK